MSTEMFPGIDSIGRLKNIAHTGRTATYVIAASDATVEEQAQSNLVVDDVSDADVQTLLTAAEGGKILFRGTFTKSSATNLLLPSNIDIELQGSISLADSLDVDAAFFENSDQSDGNENISIHGGVYDCNRTGQSAGEQTFCDFVNVDNYKIDTNIKNYTIFEAWLKLCTGDLINRRFLVKPILFDACSDIATWTVANDTCANDATGSPVGGQCIKLTSVDPTAAAMDKLLPTGLDYEAYLLDFWIKADDVTKLNEVVVGGDTCSGSTSAFGGYLFGTDWHPENYPGAMMENNVWHHVQRPLNYYTSVLGAPAVRVRLIPESGQTASIWIYNMQLVPSNPDQHISFIFDDGIELAGSKYTMLAADIMSKLGHKASVGIMGNEIIGTTGFLTKTNIDNLYIRYGWDIATHDETHWNTVTTEEAIALATSAKRYNDANGWNRASSFLMFPGHDTTGALNREIMKSFTAYRNPLQKYMSAWDGNLLNYAIQTETTGDTYSVATIEKECIRRHIWTIYYSHYIGTGQMTQNMFTSLCTYFYTYGIHLQTVSEVLKDYPVSLPTSPLSPGEQKVFSGKLTAGNANAIAFGFLNPYGQDAFVDRVVVEVVTAGGTATSVMQVGIADNRSGTNLGTEFFPVAGLDLNSTGIYESRYATDTGVQVKPVTIKGSNYATDAWVVGRIKTEAASSLTGKYYIFLVGK